MMPIGETIWLASVLSWEEGWRLSIGSNWNSVVGDAPSPSDHSTAAIIQRDVDEIGQLPRANQIVFSFYNFIIFVQIRHFWNSTTGKIHCHALTCFLNILINEYPQDSYPRQRSHQLASFKLDFICIHFRIFIILNSILLQYRALDRQSFEKMIILSYLA